MGLFPNHNEALEWDKLPANFKGKRLFFLALHTVLYLGIHLPETLNGYQNVSRVSTDQSLINYTRTAVTIYQLPVAMIGSFVHNEIKPSKFTLLGFSVTSFLITMLAYNLTVAINLLDYSSSQKKMLRTLYTACWPVTVPYHLLFKIIAFYGSGCNVDHSSSTYSTPKFTKRVNGCTITKADGTPQIYSGNPNKPGTHTKYN